MPFEPYWDTEHGSWPGLYNTDGTPIKGDVIYHTHVGVWCEWENVSSLGVIAPDEFEFRDDHRFVWRCLRKINRAYDMSLRQGRWRLNHDVLELHIESCDEPDCMPHRRADFKIFDRQGRLGLEMIRLDDEVRENISRYFLLPARSGDASRVLEKACKKSRPTGALPPPFNLLETMLGMEVPAAIKKLPLSEPICCVRVYFFDTHAPREGYGVQVRVLTESLRRQVVSSRRPVDVPYELWNPLCGVANGTPGRDLGLYDADLRGSKSLAKPFAEVYDRLCESEDEAMPFLQELARRVCRKLNAHKWGPQLQTTDDFVALPADGSGFFGGEYEDDFEVCVAPDRIELLRHRGYLA